MLYAISISISNTIHMNCIYIYNTIHMYSGITSGRVLNGNLCVYLYLYH